MAHNPAPPNFRFSEDLRGAPWALMPERLALTQDMQAAAPRRVSPPGTGRDGAIAVLPLTGVLTPGGYADGGDTSLDQFAAAIEVLARDSSVSAIIVPISSPGGSVYGTQEAADAVYAAGKVKPVIGMANHLAASAAYWIGSQCSEFYCTPGGEVGSIGVYTAHMDISAMLAAAGLKVTLISAGKYKTEGSPLSPLDDEAKASIQASVDNYYAAFTQAVGRGRNTLAAGVRTGMGQGRVLNAKAALAAGMIDGIATQAQVIQRTAARASHPKANAIALERARASAARRRELDLLAI